jgi:hypothetical protein
VPRRVILGVKSTRKNCSLHDGRAKLTSGTLTRP